MSDTVFGCRKRGQGKYATQIAALFDSAARKHGLHHPLAQRRRFSTGAVPLIS
jgi:hypothetical protein